jgi:hypothetical protein
MKPRFEGRAGARSLSRVLVLIGLASGLVPASAGTLPLVGSDNQIPNGDFADAATGAAAVGWSAETAGSGIVFDQSLIGIADDGTGSVELNVFAAGDVARLVSDCIPLADPGAGFDYLLTARFRRTVGSDDATLTVDRHSDLRCEVPTGSSSQSTSAGIGDPDDGGWTLLTSSTAGGSLRIRLELTSSGGETRARWDDLALRVPNFPEFRRTNLFSQGLLGESNEDDDRFGSVAAVGDFDNDGKDDAAFGVPLEDDGGDADVGRVLVAYGSDEGLTSVGAQALTPPPQVGQLAGAALAAGDFNCDGYDDLAIGAPGYTAPIVVTVGSGAVYVVEGSPAGLDPSTITRIERSTGDLSGAPATDDRFGEALSAGNFNRDSVITGGAAYDCDDLAIGAPGVDIGTDDTGAVFLLFGSSTGIETNFSDPQLRIWHQGRSGIGGAPEDGDTFGGAVAVFEDRFVSGRLFADALAISSPEDAFDGDSGATVLLPGVANSQLMDPAGSQLLTPSDFSLPGQRFLRFGQALSSGVDYDASDLYPQFAVGAPFSNIPVALEPQTGLVAVYRPFTMDPPTVVEPPDRNTGGRFGQQVVHADTLNRGIPGELWVSEPGHTVTSPTFLWAAGQVFRLGRDVLTSSGLEFIGEEALLADDLASTDLDADDEFGALLVRGNFNGYGGDELLMGIPGWDSEFGIPRFNVGVVIEVSWDRDPVPPPDPDLLFADGFEGGGIVLRGPEA